MIDSKDIQEEWTISEICEKYVPESWEEVFKNSKNEFNDASKILVEQEKKYGKFFPLKKNLFRAFELTRLEDVRVVIFGQDPYYTLAKNGEPVAQGISFSVDRNDTVPGSLKNIYTEIKNNYPEFRIPSHGDLTAWTKQGVLLCNTCLTVNPGVPGSHGEIWIGFIKRVIEVIVSKNKNTIFVLWGNHAKKMDKFINGRCKTLFGVHPSPRSAKMGFFGCNHFKQINELLTSFKTPPIDWNLD